MLARPQQHAGVSLAEATETFLQGHARSVRQRTIETYRYVLARYVLPDLGALPVSAITTAMLSRVVHGAPVHASTQRLLRAALSACFKAALLYGWIAESPVEGVSRPRVRKPTRTVLDARQLHLFLGATARVDPTVAPIYALCGCVGLRIGEALALRASDVDLPALLLTVARTVHKGGRLGPTKDGEARTIDLPRRLASDLRPYVLAARPWLFPGKRGPLSYYRARKHLAHCCDAAGVPYVNLHSLRHTAASTLIAAGVSPVYVQRMLGHADINMTVGLYGSHLPMPRPPEIDR